MSNPETISPAEFLALSRHWPMIDVRSPSEYRQGHIPNAINIPLFNDEERAIVGTSYSRSGRDRAVARGLELAGPKLALFLQQAHEAGVRKQVLVHCWRGGMRSEAMAWLFRFAGMETRLLEGGYKAYRRHIRQALESGPGLQVVGGMTGSGKTDLLGELARAGEQVIDLEALACHKGSAFGALGQGDQPTTEQFENDLAGQWMRFDPGKIAWAEDESLNIGKVVIPEPFFRKMRNAPLLLLEVPFHQRVQRLVEEYGQYDPVDLEALVRKISRRMGNDRAGQAVEHLRKNEIRQAVSIVLEYYDKTYAYSLGSRGKTRIKTMEVTGQSDLVELALKIRTIR